MYQLIKDNKVVFQSERKIDAIYEHIKYRRRERVRLKFNSKVKPNTKRP